MKKKEVSKVTTIFLLSLPFLFFAGVIGGVSVRHGKEMAMQMSIPLSQLYADDLYFIIGAFIIALGVEITVFLFAINSYVSKTVSLEVLSYEQDTSARLLIRRDLELSQANERLHELDQKKSEFVTIVAHQLRTPLSGIKWILSMFIKKEFGPLASEQLTFIRKAYASNDRMIALVNDMLGADRIESGKVRYLFQPTELVDLVDKVLIELLPQMNAKKLTLRFESRLAKIPRVKADPEKLRDAFQNLLDNSVKYSRPHGTIEVRMKVGEHQEVIVSVKDTGIGIPKNQQKNIFDRFFRAQNAVKLETTGSGLGLFIVKNIIEGHGGRIWFESEEEKGSTFYFTLPIDETGLQAPKPTTPAVASGLYSKS